jgi:hypothetical protein
MRPDLDIIADPFAFRWSALGVSHDPGSPVGFRAKYNVNPGGISLIGWISKRQIMRRLRPTTA